MLKQYLVERDVANIGKTSDKDFQVAAARANEAIGELGHAMQWVHSYIAGDKAYCIYYAESDSIIREHAALINLPCTRIEEIGRVVTPLSGR